MWCRVGRASEFSSLPARMVPTTKRRTATWLTLAVLGCGCGGAPTSAAGARQIGPGLYCYESPEAARESLRPLSADLSCEYDRTHDCWICAL